MGSHNEKMRKPTIAFSAAVATALVVFLGTYLAAGATGTNSELKQRLLACGSIPNGSSLKVVQTTRLFINLPRDYYPNIKLIETSCGAIVTSISNGGAYGHAIGTQGKPNCWSYYLDFELTPHNKAHSGTVNIGSKSAYKAVSNYLIHFNVVASPPDATKLAPGNGSVRGLVLLGPVYPVEHNPPDPACSPRPFKTSINIWSTLTGSTYKPVVTDASGIFKLSLASGSYGLKVSPSANGSPYPRCDELAIVVVARRSQNVTVNCDTGIR
jgi:hypothetical protein